MGHETGLSLRGFGSSIGLIMQLLRGFSVMRLKHILSVGYIFVAVRMVFGIQ